MNYLHVHIHSTVSGQEEAHLVVGICVCGEGAELFTCPYPLYGLRAGGSTFITLCLFVPVIVLFTSYS